MDKDIDLDLSIKQGKLAAKLVTKTLRLEGEVDLSQANFFDQTPGSTGRHVLHTIGQYLMAFGSGPGRSDDDDDGGDGGEEDEAEPPARKDASPPEQAGQSGPGRAIQ